MRFWFGVLTLSQSRRYLATSKVDLKGRAPGIHTYVRVVAPRQPTSSRESSITINEINLCFFLREMFVSCWRCEPTPHSLRNRKNVDLDVGEGVGEHDESALTYHPTKRSRKRLRRGIFWLPSKCGVGHRMRLSLRACGFSWRI